jgi:hypothetical protein
VGAPGEDAPGLAVPVAVRVRLRAPEHGGERVLAAAHGERRGLLGVLRRFARLRGSGERKLLLVVLDRAGWHVSGRVEVPEGVGLVFLPPYSPELQPVERVWPLVDAAVANGRVETEGELWEKVEARCAYLQTQPGLIRSHTLFHWWPGGC